MATPKQFRFRILDHDKNAVVGADVELVLVGARGAPLKTTSNGAGVASFDDAGKLVGKKIELLVNGEKRLSYTLPTQHKSAYPTADIQLPKSGRGGAPAAAKHDDHSAHPAAAKHDDHSAHPAAAKHDDHDGGHHDEPEGVLVTVFERGKGKHLYGSSAYVKGHHDEVFTYDKDEDWILVPFQSDDVILVVSAIGFKPVEVELGFDQKELRVHLEAEASETPNTNWTKVAWYGLILAILAALAYGATRLGGNFAFNPQSSLSNAIVVQLLIASTAVAGICALIGRARVGQEWDFIATLGFLAAAAIAGVIVKNFGELNLSTLAAVPENIRSGVLFMGVVRWIVFIVGMAVMYAVAIANSPDMSSPGFAWDLIALIVFKFHFRMGLGFQNTDDLTLFLILKGIAMLHYLADMFQVIEWLKSIFTKNKPTVSMTPVWVAIITIGAYVGLAFAIPDRLGWVLFFVGVILGLLAEILNELTKRAELSKYSGVVANLLGLLKSNTVDGVVLAAQIVPLFALIGIY